MVKVLNVISDTNIGGAGRVLLNYLKYCDTETFGISICLPEKSLLTNPLQEAGALVYELPIIPDKSFSRRDIGVIKALIREVNPDIVHTHGSLSGRIAARQCGKKVIYTRHSVFPPSRRISTGPGRLLNKIINEHYADRIIAVSPAAKQNLTDVGIRGDMIDTIMNGVEPVTRADEKNCITLRAQYGIQSSDFVCGIIARIETYKGHIDVLEAAKILSEEKRPVKILIAGTGAYEAEVRNKAEALGLDDTVLFLGFVSNVAPLLSILDVQLNASYGTEASSLSLLEGMSIGLPAVASDYGGNPYVISHGENGLIFKTRDSAGLADAIRQLMENPALLNTLGQNAKVVFDKCFTGQVFAKNIENIYINTLKGK